MTNELTARVEANTTGFQSSMAQAATAAEQSMGKVRGYVKSVSDSLQAQQRVAQQAAATMVRAANDEAGAAEKARGAHAGVNRELLVLAHEMSQGNYSRFGGSMLVLAERTNALSFAMTAGGAATLGLGAALIGTVALIAKGAIDADHFAKALQLTGNYAAVTADQIDRMAKGQASATGQTSGGARESLQAVAGSGLFNPREIAAVSRAMGDYQRVTGATAEEALKKFAAMQDGVAKWAEESNKSMHFLSAAEYQRIKQLEDSGQQERAVNEVSMMLAQTLESRATPAVGAFARAWHFVKEEASGAADALESIGRTDTTAEALERVNNRLNLDKSQAAWVSGSMGSRGQLTQERLTLLQTQLQHYEQAMASANAAETASAGIKAKDYVDGWMRKAKATTALTEELRKYDAAVKAAADAGTPLSAADIARGRRAVYDEYTRKEDRLPEHIGQVPTAQQGFNRFEREHEEQVMAAYRAQQLADLEEQIKLGKRLNDEVSTPQQEFLKFERDQQEAVTKAVQQQALAEMELAHRQSGTMSDHFGEAFKSWADNARDQAKAAQEFVVGSINNINDAIVNMAMTGKASFADLWRSALAGLLKYELQQMELKWFTDGKGNFTFDKIAGLFGGGDAISHANGISYVPYDGYPAILHEGERVTSKQDVRRESGSVNVHMGGNTYHIGQGVSASEVAAAVARSGAQQQMELRRLIQQGKIA